MTHAESQDLLLDLAYGELDPARAQELQSHLTGCDECKAQKAALDEARRVTAPLRVVEEPSPGFDDRILEAARAQAQLEHEGNLGQVIEVTGTVRPLGIEPARIDANAPVKARPVERRRPRWMLRAALGGSVAAAAALALVVSTTLQSRQVQQAARLAAEKSYEIRVQPAAPPPSVAPAEVADKKAEPVKVAVPPPPAELAKAEPTPAPQPKLRAAKK